MVGAIAWPKISPLLASKKALSKPAAATAKKANLAVSSFVAKTVPFAEKITATGSVRADESVDLQPETNGKIVALNIYEGARVKKGIFWLS